MASDVRPLDVATLYLARRFSPHAWALELVRHVAAGGTFEDRWHVRYGIEGRLAAAANPGQSADEQESRHVEALVRLAGQDEDRMIDILAAHGLAALDGTIETPGVTRLREAGPE